MLRSRAAATRAFNSATTVGSWKRVCRHADQIVEPPSIRPRPWGRGNLLAHNWCDYDPHLQFGHDRGVVETVGGLAEFAERGGPSIRPRPWGRGNIRGRASSGGRTALQFGHDRGVVETPRVDRHVLQGPGPSIRPRPWGRGNAAGRTRQAVEGSPSIRPRPWGRGNVRPSDDEADVGHLQFGHDRGVVETSANRRRRNGRYPAAFNLQFGHDRGVVETSGSSIRQWNAEPRPSTFNSATTVGSWKLDHRTGDGRCRRTFNSATTVGSWKRRTPGRLPGGPRLQFGHDRGVVETQHLHRRDRAGGVPSIRPRPWGRGNSTTVSRVRPSISLQFGHDRGVVETTTTTLHPLKWGTLQFGHDRGVVETTPRGLCCSRPKPFNSATTVGSWKPRAGGPVRPRRTGLQFGHDRGVVETPGAAIDGVTMAALQFGHDRGVVETPARGPTRRAEPSFNSATTVGSWKHLVRDAGPGRRRRPSIRPRPWGRGNSSRRSPSAATAGTFNSATTVGSWKRDGVLVHAEHRAPSIRPRPWGRGNPAPSRNRCACRPFNSATTVGSWKPNASVRQRLQSNRPSIRPRPWGRGNAEYGGYATKELAMPSIRPRPWGRGN